MLGITNTVFARVSQPCSGARAKRRADRVLACSSVENGKSGSEEAHNGSGSGGVGAGDLLGPIGLSLGPIGMSLGASKQRNGAVSADQEADNEAAAAERVRLNALSTDEWKRTHVRPDGTVDLWLEDDFNAASRMPAGRPYGRRENVAWSGKEAADAEVAVHKVYIKAREEDGGEVMAVKAPADRYILFEAEDQGLYLPAACRMGCCTACAVKVKSGSITQPQALGLSAGLKAQGYALLCVGYAQSDLEVELQDPDEVYEMQFGQAFAQMATDKNSGSILRDDYALEIALGDE